MLSISDLKKGAIFKHAGEPYQVLNYEHSHMGRGAATVRVKAKGLISDKVLELSFKGNDRVEEADLTRNKANYLYQDTENGYFMDQEIYDQFFLPLAIIEHQIKYLKEGQTVDVLVFEGNPVAITLPVKIELRVEHTEPAIKGDTAQGSVIKPATLETGYEIQVPLFVKQGDIIRINTETEEYVERVT